MNPESPTPREQLEARLTALLLNELSPDEAAALRATIAQDAELSALEARLKQTIQIVREAGATPATEAAEQSAPLRLSAERRDKLLAHFKTVAPKEFAAPRRRQSTRVVVMEIAALLVVLACLAGLLLPVRSATKSRGQWPLAQNNLKQVGLSERTWESNYLDKNAPAPAERVEVTDRVRNSALGMVAAASDTTLATTANKALKDQPGGPVSLLSPGERAGVRAVVVSSSSSIPPSPPSPPPMANIILPAASDSGKDLQGGTGFSVNHGSSQRYYSVMDPAANTQPGGWQTVYGQPNNWQTYYRSGDQQAFAAHPEEANRALEARNSFDNSGNFVPLTAAPAGGPTTAAKTAGAEWSYDSRNLDGAEKEAGQTIYLGPGTAPMVDAYGNLIGANNQTLVAGGQINQADFDRNRVPADGGRLFLNQQVSSETLGLPTSALASANPNVLRVDGSKIVGVGLGTATVTATLPDNSTVSRDVTVTPLAATLTHRWSFNEPSASPEANSIPAGANGALAANDIFSSSRESSVPSPRIIDFADQRNADFAARDNETLARVHITGGATTNGSFVDLGTNLISSLSANGGGSGGGGFGLSASLRGFYDSSVDPPIQAQSKAGPASAAAAPGTTGGTVAGATTPAFNPDGSTFANGGTAPSLGDQSAAGNLFARRAAESEPMPMKGGGMATKGGPPTTSDDNLTAGLHNLQNAQEQTHAVSIANAEPADLAQIAQDIYPQGQIINRANTTQNNPLVQRQQTLSQNFNSSGSGSRLNTAATSHLGQSVSATRFGDTQQAASAGPNYQLASQGHTSSTIGSSTMPTPESAALVQQDGSRTPMIGGFAGGGGSRGGRGGRGGGGGGGGGFGGGGAGAGSSTTRTYPNAGPGPVSVVYDPESGNLVVLTDDKTFQSVSNLVRQLDRPRDADQNGLVLDNFRVQNGVLPDTAILTNPWGSYDGTTNGSVTLAQPAPNQNLYAARSANFANPIGNGPIFDGNEILPAVASPLAPPDVRSVNVVGYMNVGSNSSGGPVGGARFRFAGDALPLQDTGTQPGAVAADALVQDGRYLYEAGRYDEAEAQFNKALAMDKASLPAAHYMELIQEKKDLQNGFSSKIASVRAMEQVTQERDVPQRVREIAQNPAPPSAPVAAKPAVSARDSGLVRQVAQIAAPAAATPPPPPAVMPATEDRPAQQAPAPLLVPQPETLVRENAFSTFSLNVSDVAFKLSAASLQQGRMPDPGSVRSEEFINAFDYRDPDPAPGQPVGFAWERARYPFAHNRDLLRFSIKTASAGRQPGRPLNLVLLLDNSGSMERADRVAILREALRVLATQLQPGDKISVVTFSRTAQLRADGIAGDRAGEVLRLISELTPEGGTNLGDALDLAYAIALRHYFANGVNRVVLLTDGAANLGNVDPEALKLKVQAQRAQGIALDCFGIGWEDYNDDLLEILTRNADGRYGFLNSPEEAASGFAGQLAGALHVAAADVKVQVEFNPGRVVSYRQIGYAKHQLTKEQFRDNTVHAAQIGAAEAGNGLYTVEVNPQGTGPICTVRLRFRDPATGEVSEHAWDVPYEGPALALDQASPAMRLAATASAFSEWLAQSPYAGDVSTDELLNDLRGVPAVFGADTRPQQLEAMIREAKSLTGK